MKKHIFTAAVAAVASAALMLGTAAPAIAEELPAPATLSILQAPAILTLPAGDGVRDSDLLRVASDVPTTATVRVLAADLATVLATLPDIEFHEGALTADIPLQVRGLPAGASTVEIVPASGVAVTTTLIVGSGEPRTVRLSTSRSVVYTWKRSPATSATARVSATDETGLAIPFSARITAERAGVSRTTTVRSSTGAAASATLQGSTLGTGTWKLSAAVSAQGVTTVSAPRTLTVRKVAVTGAKFSRSEATVYPAKDGYRDSTKLSLQVTTTTGAAIPVTGTVTIARQGKVVKKWNLTSSRNWSKTWNGKVGGRIVEGRYVVTMSVAGPEGSKITKRASVTVKEGKLVTKTHMSRKLAMSVFKAYVPFDRYKDGYCADVSDKLYCVGYDAFETGVISLVALGRTGLPDKVERAQKYGRVKTRLTLHTTSLRGEAVWGYLSDDAARSKVTQVVKGNSTPGWMTLPKGSTHVVTTLGLGTHTRMYADTIKVEYQYKVMVR